jgi:hypothetical protein
MTEIIEVLAGPWGRCDDGGADRAAYGVTELKSHNGSPPLLPSVAAGQKRVSVLKPVFPILAALMRYRQCVADVIGPQRRGCLTSVGAREKLELSR